MPQGDDPSVYLFNIFMDDFIHAMNTAPSRGLVMLLLDDVLLLAKTMTDIKRLVIRSERWADKAQMQRATDK